MTAIAIWCNHERAENPGLWIAADSRVSTGSGPLLDDAAKVFPLPIVCRSADANGLFTNRYYDHAYGYCFAGDTLLGQNTYLSLVPLLANLASSKSYVPSLADVAGYVHTYLSATFNDCKVVRGRSSLFETALFGYCSRTRMLSAFHFRCDEDEGGMQQVVCLPHENMKTNDFLYLGSEKPHMISEITAALAVDSTPLEEFAAKSAGRPLSRIPRYVIEDHINNAAFPTVSGDLQLGIADKFGFRGFPLCKPSATGQAIIRYLGRELTADLQYVGGPSGALVGSDAMV